MSALPPKAEVARHRWHFRYVPKTEVKALRIQHLNEPVFAVLLASCSTTDVIDKLKISPRKPRGIFG